MHFDKSPCIMNVSVKSTMSLSRRGTFSSPMYSVHLAISTKRLDLPISGKFMAASFPCFSLLSRPSAVCFLLTFSSCAQTLPEVLLTEPGLWEWAGSQHWPEISSSNWITRRGGSHYTYTEVGSEKNIPAVS